MAGKTDPGDARPDSNTVTLEMEGGIYEGAVLDGKPHGSGRFRYADGGFCEGGWQCGVQHGQGTYTSAAGDRYEGEWKGGKFHGIGTLTDAKGYVYHGGLKYGLMHGNGKKVFENGNVYEGEWERGAYHGFGTLRYAPVGNGLVYEGQWADGRSHGKGTLTYANEDAYEGDFVDGLFHGTGTFKWANGDVYTGEWKDDKKHGLGTLTSAEGMVTEGEWREGKLERLRTNNSLREKARHALASILLKDDVGIDEVDVKFVSYLADLIHENGFLGKQTNHSAEDILRPWLKGFSFDGNLAKECSDAVMASVDDATTYAARAPTDGIDVMFLNVVNEGDNAKERYDLLRSKPFETFLKNYAISRSASVRRFKHKGRTVFLSSIRKKSPKDLGLEDGDEIRVTAISNKVTTATEKKESKPQPQTSKGKDKKKRHKKSNRKKSMPALPPESKEEKLKEQHSQALSRVFEEADTQFRDIRQKLAAINLQRATPKQRRSQPKGEPVAAETITDNPRAEGLGGKAGKSHFIVQVGEASNLYNTRAKHSNGNKQPTGRIAGEVDLHCCTQVEALAKLDECMPEWMDTAMKGEYPWVICVRIVCGGGTQTLAEAVEGWIKRNPNVSNAPKNLYS